MNVYETKNIKELLDGNNYVGRGLIIGYSEDGQYAVTAYFIEGRSANSQNRVFIEKEDGLFTSPFDPSKVEDPSLIIYPAMRRCENKLIVTNGDQTDTVYEGLRNNKTFMESLMSREFEPDAPNFTPRISGMITFLEDDFKYEMSILKSADEKGSSCNRFHYMYSPIKGVGHFLHTYVCNDNPCPSFVGEPERIFIDNDIDAFTNEVWNALDENNRISLYTTYTNIATKEVVTRLINKNK